MIKIVLIIFACCCNHVLSGVTSSKYHFASECGENEPCVRFCCDNVTACSDHHYFDLSSWPEAQNLQQNYTVVKGRPPCEMYAEEDHVSWELLKVCFETNLETLLRFSILIPRMELFDYITLNQVKNVIVLSANTASRDEIFCYVFLTPEKLK